MSELPGELRPDDRIIEDDEALDRWYIEFRDNQARQTGGGPSGPRVSYRDAADALPTFQPR